MLLKCYQKQCIFVLTIVSLVKAQKNRNIKGHNKNKIYLDVTSFNTKIGRKILTSTLRVTVFAFFENYDFSASYFGDKILKFSENICYPSTYFLKQAKNEEF